MAHTPNPEANAMLRQAWVAEIRRWWEQYNEEFLDGVLQPPQILIADTERTLGSWDSTRRSITLSSAHIMESRWSAVLDTLRHEMAHQLCDEHLLGANDEPPHGPTFRIACRQLRVEATASQRPAPKDGDDAHEAGPGVRLLRKIEKLLSLSSSPNQHEADAAFQKARQLMAEHQIEHVIGSRDSANYSALDLGPVKGRHQVWEFALANLLERFFFVQTIWTHTFDARRNKRGTVLRLYGTGHDLALAEHVYEYLTTTVQRLWEDYRKQRGLRGHRDRQQYYHGLLLGFGATLEQQESRLHAQHPALVVAAHNPELDAFFRHHHPRIQTTRRGRGQQSQARSDGAETGRSIRLHRPIRQQADSGGGRLLGYDG